MQAASRGSRRRPTPSIAEIASAGRRLAGVGDQQTDEEPIECRNGTSGCHGGHGSGLPCAACFLEGDSDEGSETA